MLKSAGQVHTTMLRLNMRISLIFSIQHVAYVGCKCCDRLTEACKCWTNNVRICCAQMSLAHLLIFTVNMRTDTFNSYSSRTRRI